MLEWCGHGHFTVPPQFTMTDIKNYLEHSLSCLSFVTSAIAESCIFHKILLINMQYPLKSARRRTLHVVLNGQYSSDLWSTPALPPLFLGKRHLELVAFMLWWQQWDPQHPLPSPLDSNWTFTDVPCVHYKRQSKKNRKMVNVLPRYLMLEGLLWTLSLQKYLQKVLETITFNYMAVVVSRRPMALARNPLGSLENGG